MKIKRQGTVRFVTERAFLQTFKPLGYEIVEEPKQEKTVDDYTKAEIMELLDEKGIEYNDRDKKADLFELLKEG